MTVEDKEKVQEVTGEVVLAADRSALEILHAVLMEGVSCAGMEAAQLPQDVATFRRDYPDALARYEATRLNSTERFTVAHRLLLALMPYLQWQDARGTVPLAEALSASTVAPLPLRRHQFSGSGGWPVNVVYRGERYGGDGLGLLAERLLERHVVTPEARDALVDLAQGLCANGSLDLKGRKIAIFGGGAEMAPTRLWLEAGADVLWLDVAEPPASWFEITGMSGALSWAEGNVDLLTQPREVLATLKAFADGDPLDLGLYAYAPGRARELRLTGTMNAMVDALPRELIGSVTMLVSPTTSTGLGDHDVAVMSERLTERPAWERVCDALGLLGRGGGSVAAGDARVARTVVAIQGASYQAAQYLGKVLTAEYWSRSGQLASPGAEATTVEALRVSANTAAITQTRSLDHPVFAAAFGGAAAMGVETMTPRQSRRLNGLLAVRDWTSQEAPVPGRIRVHGGIHTLPYPLQSALRVAAAIGFVRAPRLLRALLKPRR